ncbi:uncharacterized protein MELLADRAFT_115312 [Melampsora larici-populina 98AG31]|uniref:Uncharacterized protein n=1 Tax=Melampsora larici-populina (strain 98AG31 / pathotype 3-4-7) TaxID=747676 RepID=F4R8X5_MELLP|nr:uncharacterized protein MELLADRAFT_115312 [Melampsora larici-populina 98AG31]EGG11252.1 hypothetical protein MELLADRAFT_115312 [Melampsora larici-populina 98AG31]
MKTDNSNPSNLTPRSRIPTKRKAHHLLNHLKSHHQLQDPSIDIKPFDTELHIARPGTPTIILDHVSQPLSDSEDPLILKDSPTKQANRHLRRQSRAHSNFETFHHHLPLIKTLESNQNQYSLPSASISTATFASPGPDQLNTPTRFSSENRSRPESHVKDNTVSKSPLPRSSDSRDHASISATLNRHNSPHLSGKDSQHMTRITVSSRQERNSSEGSLARNSCDSSTATRLPSAVPILEPPSHIQLDDQSSDGESDTPAAWPTNLQDDQQNQAQLSSPPPTPSSRGPSRSSSAHETIISQPRGSSSSQFLEIVHENIVVSSSSASSVASSDTCRPTSRRKATQSVSSASIRSSLTPLNNIPPKRSPRIDSASSREVLTSDSTNQQAGQLLDRYSNQKTSLPLRSPTIKNQSVPSNRIMQLNHGSTSPSSPNTSFQALRHKKRLGTPPKPREWDKHNAFQEFEIENSDVEVTITCADDDHDGIRQRKRSRSRLTMGHVEMVLQNWPPEENVVLQSTPKGLLKIHRHSDLPFTPILPRPSMRASQLLEEEDSLEDENSGLAKMPVQEDQHVHHTETHDEEVISPSEDDRGETDDHDLEQEDEASPDNRNNPSSHCGLSGQEDDIVPPNDDQRHHSSMSMHDACGQSRDSPAHYEKQTHQELADEEMADSSQDDNEDEPAKSCTDSSSNNSDGQTSSDRVTRTEAMGDVSALYESDSERSRQREIGQAELSESSIRSNSRSDPDQMSDSNQANPSNPDLLSHSNQETTPDSDQVTTPQQDTLDLDPAAGQDADSSAPKIISREAEVQDIINARDTTPVHGPSSSSSSADRVSSSESQNPPKQFDISKRSVHLPTSQKDSADGSVMITPPMEFQSVRLGAPATSSRGSDGIHPPSQPIFDTRSQSSSCGRLSSDRTSSHACLKNDQYQKKEQFQSIAQQLENKRQPLLTTIDDMIDPPAVRINSTRRSLLTSTPHGTRLQRPSPFLSPIPSNPSRVLQISSSDPKTAAQAAAILKVYHGFIPRGFKIEDNEAINHDQLEHQMEESILKEEARAERSLFYQQHDRNKTLSVVDEDKDDEDEDEEDDEDLESNEDRIDEMVSNMLSPRPNKTLNRIDTEEGERRKEKSSSVFSQQHVPQSSSSKPIPRIKSLSSNTTTTNYSSPMKTLNYKADFNYWTKTDWQILESCLRKAQRASNSSNPVHPTTVVLKLLKVLKLDRNQCQKEWEWSCLVRRVKALQKKSELNDHQYQQQREISLGIGSSNGIELKGKRSLFHELNDLSKS